MAALQEELEDIDEVIAGAEVSLYIALVMKRVLMGFLDGLRGHNELDGCFST